MKQLSNPHSSNTYMLFKSGDSTVVNASLHSASKSKNRPVDAYVVTEYENEFTRAARRAAQAVFDTTPGLFENRTPLSVAYDLCSLPANVSLTGQSGGLPFALALAKKLHPKDPGPVAATGEIIGGDGSGCIGPIRGIEEKLEAAGRVLPVGGWVIYPKANDREISDRLRKMLLKKGLRLKAVASVQEALAEIYTHIDTRPKKGTRPKRRFRRLAIAMVLVLSGLAAWGYWKKGRPPLDTIETKPETTVTRVEPESPASHKIPLSETKAVPPTPKTPVSTQPEPVKISLTGNTIMSEQIARRMSIRLLKPLKRRAERSKRRIQLSGRINMVKIVEQMDETTGELRSAMTVSISELTLGTDMKRKTFASVTVQLKGVGSARMLIPKAVNELLRHISVAVGVEKSRARR